MKVIIQVFTVKGEFVGEIARAKEGLDEEGIRALWSEDNVQFIPAPETDEEYFDLLHPDQDMDVRFMPNQGFSVQLPSGDYEAQAMANGWDLKNVDPKDDPRDM